MMKMTESLFPAIANEICLVTIPVAHFREFDTITREEVSFRVFRQDDWFKALPQMTAEQRKVTGIPAELIFVYWDYVILAANNMEEEAMNVIKSIIVELEVLEHV
jgi:hypothetical protein